MGVAAAKEGSMEDILASIRKIISSDEGNSTGSQAKANELPVDKSIPTPPVNKVSEVRHTPAPEPAPASSSASVEAASSTAAPKSAAENIKPTTGPASGAAKGSLAELAASVSSGEFKSAEPTTVSAPSKVQETVEKAVVAPKVEKAEAAPSAVSGSDKLKALTEKVRSDAQTSSNPSSPTVSAKPVETAEASKAASVDAQAPKPAPAKPVMAKTSAPSLKSIAQTLRETNSIADAVSEPEAAAAPEVGKVESVKAETTTTAPETAKPEAEKFKEALVSPATQIAVSSSMDRLKKSVEDNQAAHVEATLRPMLREWLDANLPDMVEKMVREEIDRIAKPEAQ